ncbi:MAG: hypothetical protein M1434_13340 [Chloroflexi bacterium]|nr:hypothetical protein [Chloroflexota bacterium]
MNASELTLEQVREIGLQSLLRDLGPVGMIRFLQQFELGYGDYTHDRSRWLNDFTVQALAQEIASQRHARTDNT